MGLILIKLPLLPGNLNGSPKERSGSGLEPAKKSAGYKRRQRNVNQQSGIQAINSGSFQPIASPESTKNATMVANTRLIGVLLVLVFIFI